MRGSSKWIETSDGTMKYDVFINGARRRVAFTLSLDEPAGVDVVIDGRSGEANAVKMLPGIYSILLGGRSLEATVEETAATLLVRVAGREFQVQITDPRS